MAVNWSRGPFTANVSAYLQVSLGRGLNHPSLDPAALYHKLSKAVDSLMNDFGFLSHSLSPTFLFILNSGKFEPGRGENWWVGGLLESSGICTPPAHRSTSADPRTNQEESPRNQKVTFPPAVCRSVPIHFCPGLASSDNGSLQPWKS